MEKEGGAAGQALAPAWLATAFPGHDWQTLRSCRLHLDEEGGAGLDLEASELGYLVDAVAEEPGQDSALCAGTVIIEIGGCSLLGLEEEALEDGFGGHFRDGAQLLLLAVEELRQAVAAREAKAKAGPQPDVVLEHGSVVHVYLCSAKDMDDLAPDTLGGLTRDLETFATRGGIRAEIYRPQDGTVVNVVLTGVPGEIGAARPELGALLQHYGLGLGTNGGATPGGRGVEKIEVGGMVMQSLPARGRRRRRAPEDDNVGRGEKLHARQAACLDAGDGGEGAAEGDAEEGAGALLKVCGKEVRQYEYMDHTADVILHSWGVDLQESFAQVCVAFFSYMTDLDTIQLRTSFEVEATGHDILDLLYHLLDEFLFNFGTEFVMCRRVEILELDEPGLRVRARGYGEKFDLSKHPQGTEIKAITMHQMKILTPNTLTSEDGTIPRKDSEKEGGRLREGFPFECYVLVDI